MYKVAKILQSLCDEHEVGWAFTYKGLYAHNVDNQTPVELNNFVLTNDYFTFNFMAGDGSNEIIITPSPDRNKVRINVYHDEALLQHVEILLTNLKEYILDNYK